MRLGEESGRRQTFMSLCCCISEKGNGMRQSPVVGGNVHPCVGWSWVPGEVAILCGAGCWAPLRELKCSGHHTGAASNRAFYELGRFSKYE